MTQYPNRDALMGVATRLHPGMSREEMAVEVGLLVSTAKTVGCIEASLGNTTATIMESALIDLADRRRSKRAERFARRGAA